VKPKICAVVFGEKLVEIASTIKNVEKLSDLIEIRFDLSGREIEPKKIRKLTSVPLIATNRSKPEGGRFEGPAKKQLEKLLKAAEAEFDYVDLEVSSKISEEAQRFRSLGVKPIISFHNFKETPNTRKLDEILKKQKGKSDEICKIVSMARRIEDNLTILNFLYSAVKDQVKIIAFCMGKLGLPSRILSPIFGGYLTYASAMRGKEAAPGQLTLEELRQIYRLMGFKD
jgi:3-dehydroquinate dehydratase type I